MSLWSRIKTSLTGPVEIDEDVNQPGVSQDEKDTISVIRDLSKIVKSNPDAVETYLALGSLFRSRGDLERAVQIRESLLVRQDIPAHFKARVFFELGQDYRRAGILDRALQAYGEALRLGIPKRLVDAEQAQLYADSGDWLKAAQFFSAIGNSQAEAHYLARQAGDIVRQNPAEHKKALRFIEKAVKVYQPSPEGWSSLVSYYIKAGKWPVAAKMFQKALELIAPDKTFMLFEELLDRHPSDLSGAEKLLSHSAEKQDIIALYTNMAEHFLPHIEKRQPDLASYYFGALVLKRCERFDQAEQWLNKALILYPDFWFGRLAQLEIARGQHGFPPVLAADLDYFIEQSKKLRRFVCTRCGLSRDVLFYCCPRCRSWHSAAYKLSLND